MKKIQGEIYQRRKRFINLFRILFFINLGLIIAFIVNLSSLASADYLLQPVPNYNDAIITAEEFPVVEDKIPTESIKPVNPIKSVNHAVYESSRGSYENRRSVVFHTTAYTSALDEGNGHTCFGKPVISWDEPGPATAAVDPTFIPYETLLYIPYFKDYPCQGLFIASDCGGAIKGYKLDLGAPSKTAALNFGRRNITVYIIDK